MPHFFAMSRIVVLPNPIFWKSWSETSRIFFFVASFFDSRRPMASFRSEGGRREGCQARGAGAKGREQEHHGGEQQPDGHPDADGDPGRSPAGRGASGFGGPGADPDPARARD